MLTHIIEILLGLTFDRRTNQEELPMQMGRKLLALASIAVLVAALAFSLTPSSAQKRGGAGAGYGAGVQHGDGGYRYGNGGFGGTTGQGSGGAGQSLRDIFRGLDSTSGDQLRERRGDQQDFLRRRTHDRKPR